MLLSRNEIEKTLKEWNLAWDNHDLEDVMAFFHEKVVFDNWTGGRVKGKDALRKAWAPWFANHGDFRFKDGKIINKFTYSKTTTEIDGKRHPLHI